MLKFHWFLMSLGGIPQIVKNVPWGNQGPRKTHRVLRDGAVSSSSHLGCVARGSWKIEKHDTGRDLTHLWAEGLANFSIDIDSS